MRRQTTIRRPLRRAHLLGGLVLMAAVLLAIAGPARVAADVTVTASQSTTATVSTFDLLDGPTLRRDAAPRPWPAVLLLAVLGLYLTVRSVGVPRPARVPVTPTIDRGRVAAYRGPPRPPAR